MLPSSLPLSVLIESEDDDGAAGGIVRESIFLDACLIFDGLTYGDGDGRLADETIVLDVETLCRAASACGFDVLDHPQLALDAADCGGNHDLASVGLRGAISLRPGVCGSR